MTEAARVSIGLPAAIAVAPFLPVATRSAVVRGIAAAAICAWAIYPGGFHLPVAVVAGAVTVAAGLWNPVRAERFDALTGSVIAVAALGVTALIASAAVDSGALWAAMHRAIRSDRTFVYSLGLLVAVFPTGALIGSLTRQWSSAIEQRLRSGGESMPRGLEGAGRYIGSLERVVIYAALILGHIDAAAIVLTAKAIARFPSFSDEGFAEYFLIGTLLSVICGGAAAVAARLLLGVPAL